MVATAGTAVTLAASPAQTQFFDDPVGATEVFVKNVGANVAEIHVPGLHADGDFFPIAVGADCIFRLDHMGIRKIFGRGVGGTTDVDFGVKSKTFPHGTN